MSKEGTIIRYEEQTLDVIVKLAKERGIIIVPAATTEGHGYHLPTGTDTFIAEWISGELSKITGLPTLMPTPIRLGCSPTIHFDRNGDPLVGTLAIGHDTMQRLCLDLCRGLYVAGFRKVIIVQGHGQEWNFQAIAQEVATLLRREGKGLFIAAGTYWELARKAIEETIDQPFWHAGEWESSAVLCARPDLVKMDQATGEVRIPLIDKTLIKRSVAQDESEAFALQDVAQWNPIPEPGELHPGGVGLTEKIKTASSEKGKFVLERALSKYLALIRDLEMYYAPDEVPGIDVKRRPSEPRFTVSY